MNQENRERITAFKSGAEMWNDYRVRFGIVAAHCICQRYIKCQTTVEDASEVEFCRQLIAAMESEPSFAGETVYRYSPAVAELSGDKTLYSESDRINRLCAGDIDVAMSACESGDGTIDHKTALMALRERYGLVRLRFVLSCEVRHGGLGDQCPADIHKWARGTHAHESYGSYGIRTRPDEIVKLINAIRHAEHNRKIGGAGVRNKLDFYLTFYEGLAEHGFQAYVAASPKHIADICVNQYNIAHLTKADTIEPNPYAEGVEEGTIEKIREIAKNAAMFCGACGTKPYDESKHERMPDGSYKLVQFEDTALTCKQHPILGYVFSVAKQADGYEVERADYYNITDAKRGFAISGGLVDGQIIFTDKEIAAIYANAIKIAIARDNGLSPEESFALDAVIARIEGEKPELCGLTAPTHQENESDLTEGVER